MQENKPPLTFKNTKKKICLEKKREFFLTLTPIVYMTDITKSDGLGTSHQNYCHMTSLPRVRKVDLEIIQMLC